MGDEATVVAAVASTTFELSAVGVLVEDEAGGPEAALEEATVSAAATAGTLMLTPDLLQRDWAKARVAVGGILARGSSRRCQCQKTTLLIRSTAGLLDRCCKGSDEGDGATDALEICEAA